MRYEPSQVEMNAIASGEQTGTAYERPAVVSRVLVSGLLSFVDAS